MLSAFCPEGSIRAHGSALLVFVHGRGLFVSEWDTTACVPSGGRWNGDRDVSKGPQEGSAQRRSLFRAHAPAAYQEPDRGCEQGDHPFLAVSAQSDKPKAARNAGEAPAIRSRELQGSWCPDTWRRFVC